MTRQDRRAFLETPAAGVFATSYPWNWNHRSFEGNYIDPVTLERRACADLRRTAQAEGA